MSASTAVTEFPKMPFEEYLRHEQRANQKNEYFYGLVYAMAGGTRNHSLIASAAISALNQALAGRDCSVYESNMLIETPNQSAGFYPALSVRCGSPGGGSERTEDKPSVVVEVLSPSTRAYDLSAKRMEYMLIPSLRHIVFIDSETVEVKVYSRSDRNTWPNEPAIYSTLDSEFSLDAIGVNLRVSDLYLRTNLA